MKKILLIIVMFLICINTYSQIKLYTNDKPVVNKKYIVYTKNIIKNKPDIFGKEICKIYKGDIIKILDIKEHGYLKVINLNNKKIGYINEVILYHSNNTNNKNINDNKKDINKYGKPNNISEYKEGNYRSLNYIWYCVNNNYIDISYIYKNGKWIRDSIYKSDCIR